MTKWIMLALLTLAASAVPTFAAETPAPGKAEMKHMMHQDPGMMQQMKQNPQHKLAMAYHKNLVSFARALGTVARQGDTLPRDFARAAVTEMRRSADQMEIYHEAALATMPAQLKAKQGEMIKTMSGHLAEMRTQLAELDTLTKGDRVDSKEVLKRLQLLFKGCEGMCHDGGMCPQGMRGEGRFGKGMNCGRGHGCMHEGMQGGRGHGCMHEGMQGGCGHGGMHEGMQGGCGHGGMHEGMPGAGRHGGKMRGGREGGWQEMMQQRHKMMDAMRAQDAELAKMVDAMNGAPNDKKQALMAQVLTRLVKQRVEMDAQMEKMQDQMKHHMEGEMHHSMQGMGNDDDSEDADYDSDSDDMNVDDMDSDDSDGPPMDMKDMNMQDMGK